MLTVQNNSFQEDERWFISGFYAYIYSLEACVRIVSRFRLHKQPEESVNFNPTLLNKMKAVIVLLATAVAFAYGASHLTLKTLSSKVRDLHKETLNTVRLLVSLVSFKFCECINTT